MELLKEAFYQKAGGFKRLTQSGVLQFSGIGLGLALVKAYVAVMDGELGVQSSQEPTASTGTGSTFWLEITLPKAREEDLYSSSSPMRMGRKNSSQRVSFEQQREGFFLGGSGSEGDGGETTAAEGGGQSGTLDERLRGGEATERPGLQEGFDGSLGGSIRRLQKEGAESPSTRVEAWQAVVANNVVHGLDSSNSESTSSKAGGLAQVNVNLPKRGAYSAPDLDRGVVKQAGELPPKENLPPEAAPQKSLFRGEEGKADPAPAVFDVAAKKPNGLVDTIVVCADPSLKVRQTVSQYLASETIHVVTGSSLRKALTGAARQAAQMRADPGRSKDARVVVVALVSSALEKPKELPQVGNFTFVVVSLVVVSLGRHCCLRLCVQGRLQKGALLCS